MSVVNKATARFASAVELYKDGSISWYRYATLDGETWGIVSRTDCANPYANPGSVWEAREIHLPNGEMDWQAMIAANPMDWDAPPSGNVAARFMAGSDWLPWWEANFEMAGRSSPSGLPYYRYKGG